MADDILPENRTFTSRDVFDMIIVQGLERVTQSLRMGDRHTLTNLRPLAGRCRALADAFDARMKETNLTTD
jgi:hypothetical protein